MNLYVNRWFFFHRFGDGRLKRKLWYILSIVSRFDRDVSSEIFRQGRCQMEMNAYIRRQIHIPNGLSLGNCYRQTVMMAFLGNIVDKAFHPVYDTQEVGAKGVAGRVARHSDSRQKQDCAILQTRWTCGMVKGRTGWLSKGKTKVKSGDRIQGKTLQKQLNGKMHKQLISLIQFPFVWQTITYFENWSHQEVLLHRQKSVKRHKVSNSNEHIDNSFNNTPIKQK